MSRFGTYIGSGVTVRYDFGTTEKKNLLCSGSFHLFWTDLYAKKQIINTNTIITLLYYLYNICFGLIVSVHAPFWIPVFVIRPHAPNREVRTVTVRYEYMYRVTPITQ